MNYQRRLWPTVISLSMCLCALDAIADEQQDEVLKVADRALELITNEDFAGLAGLMVADGVTVSTRLSEGSYQVRTQSASEQAATEPSVDLIERGFDPTVMVSGPVAMVWYPYDIYVDDNWSHCGIDIFSFVRTDEGWKIGSLVYSAEQPPQCQPHPDGNPH